MNRLQRKLSNKFSTPTRTIIPPPTTPSVFQPDKSDITDEKGGSESESIRNNLSSSSLFKRPYRALSLDGGGARGLFTLKLLSIIAKERIAKKTSVRGAENVKPYSFSDEFDVIYGVSVGGIIGAAIALGLFDDPEVREQLIHDGKDIFGEKNDLQPLLAPLYTGREKKALIKHNFKNLRLKDCKCKLVILVTTVTFHPYQFESWNPLHENLLVADVLNATSAAPFYFPPAEIPILSQPGARKHRRNNQLFWDGGMFSNCPIDLSVLKLKQLFNPNHEIEPFHFQVLSIGTSLPPQEAQLDEEPEIDDPNNCGLFLLFKLGVTKAVGGLYNTTAAELMRYEYGSDVILRLTAELDPKFDDVSDNYQSALKLEAIKIHDKYNIDIQQFFSKRVMITHQ